MEINLPQMPTAAGCFPELLLSPNLPPLPPDFPGGFLGAVGANTNNTPHSSLLASSSGPVNATGAAAGAAANAAAYAGAATIAAGPRGAMQTRHGPMMQLLNGDDDDIGGAAAAGEQEATAHSTQ